METTAKQIITVAATINAPIDKVWQFWTEPQHITQWNNASEDWHTPRAENDLREGGKFLSRMEARDGSFGFDFEGIYDTIIPEKLIAYHIIDGRKVKITFEAQEGKTRVTETFDADNQHAAELQQQGWQAILDNFKKYVESSGIMGTLHFEITINASAKKVYTSMIDEQLYKVWTAEFNPTSHYIGSWDKGAKILFIGADENGQTGGMVSRIREHIPHKFISIEHLGLYQQGQEITTGPEIEQWAGAQENYTFTENNGKTLLEIDMDGNPEFNGYFSATWPKALLKIKEICEE